MKLLKGEFTNFGSYKHLEFDFSNLGLALAFGRTGSGKSTIPDLAAWTLFGVTAKDGSVDDVRSWLTPGEPTIGKLEVDVNGTKIQITRVRGKLGQNDLSWIESSGDPVRGKDLNDTQKLLEARLGVSVDLYLTGAYFHEFSSTGTFFTAKAKDRRAVFEKIASLDLAVRLGEATADDRKSVRKDLSDATSRANTLSGRQDQMVRSLRDARERLGDFQEATTARIAEYQTKSDSFERTKIEKIAANKLKAERWQEEKTKKIDGLLAKCDRLDAKIKPENWGIKDLEEDLAEAKKSKCPTCGGPKASVRCDEIRLLLTRATEKKNICDQLVADRKRLISDLEDVSEEANSWEAGVVSASMETNTYVERIEEEKKKVNPFSAQVARLEGDLVFLHCEINDEKAYIEELETKISNLTQLYDISFELRGELLKQAVQNAQDSTNRYLEKYFDSEIRVGFALEGSDDLIVSIQKSGYGCAYKQLSRGQRALLRMTFVVSIMKAAANRAGVHFDNLFFDEILDGMDADLKIKAFSLLEELSTEHESILVVDHDTGFQNLFTKRFHVTMEADTSQIEELNE